MRPNAAERVERQQAKQVQHNASSRDRQFEGDQVFVRNYQQGEQWVPGVIQDCTGPVSFRVKLQDGRVRRRHLDQVRSRSVNVPQVVEYPSVDVPATEPVPTQISETLPPSEMNVVWTVWQNIMTCVDKCPKYSENIRCPTVISCPGGHATNW